MECVALCSFRDHTYSSVQHCVGLLQIIKGPVDPTAAPEKVADRLRHQQMIIALNDHLTHLFGVAQVMIVFVKQPSFDIRYSVSVTHCQ